MVPNVWVWLNPTSNTCLASTQKPSKSNHNILTTKIHTCKELLRMTQQTGFMQDNNFTSHTFLVDMWMLIHVYIQTISDVFSDLKLATNTHVTHMHTYVQVIPAIIYDFYELFCSLFFTQPSPIQLCFYPSTTHFTCPNNRSTGCR